MRTHITKTTRAAAALQQSPPLSAMQTLVVSLVLSRLCYDNATLAGMPAYFLRRLQSILDAAAKTITGLLRSAHISTTLASLHWLHAAKCIKFKLTT